MRRSIAISALLVALAVTPAMAALGPDGPQFIVNTETASDQGYGFSLSCGYWKHRGLAIASDGAGGAGDFVVVWHSFDQDGSGRGVFGQRFDASGTPQGGEFQVNQTIDLDQWTPVVSMNSSGGFVVAWNDGASYYYADIFARVYDDAGAPIGPELQVSANRFDYLGETYFNYSSIQNPAIEQDAAGNFVVVWERSNDYSSYDGRDIMARKFDAGGAPLTGVFQVSDPASGEGENYWNRTPDVAVKSSGEFVVVWTAIPPQYGYAVIGQRFDANANPQGGEFQVNTTLTYDYGSYSYPVPSYFESTPDAIFDSSGGFLVVWSSSGVGAELPDDPPFPIYEVAARFFHAGGAPKGPEFQVSSVEEGYPESYDGCPTVAELSDGSFAVAWDSNDAGRQGKRRLIAPSGVIGSEFHVNTDSERYFFATSPVVAPLEDGFVVAWTDASLDGYGALEGHEVYAQRYADVPSTHACAPAPLDGCREVTKLKKGALVWSRGATPKRQRFQLKWSQGEATSREDFGFPKVDTDYAVCVYDSSGTPLRFAAELPAGGTCGSIPCWRPLGGDVAATEYFNRLTNDDGIKRLRLRPGTEGKASVSAQGIGENLSLPTGPLTPPVQAQVQASNGTCFTAVFDTFIAKNEANKFSARSGTLP